MPAESSPARPGTLRCEHLENPVGLDEPSPRFSWQLRDERMGARQTAYELAVTTAEGGRFWSTGRVAGDDALLIPYAGPKLRPHSSYRWLVRLWDHAGAVTPWSKPAQWTTGFLGARWPKSATWIGMRVADANKSTPVRYLRSPVFALAARPRAALLHISALGVFEAHLNGAKIGRDALTPGWTDYRRRTEYLTYDVTAQLVAGPNVLSALLADGWYAGKLVWHGQRRLYGTTPALLAALRIVLADGTEQWITSGRDWRMATGAWLGADLYDGEEFDARADHTGWTTADFSASAWRRVHGISVPKIALNAKHTPPIRAVETLRPRLITEPSAGRFIFDLGQNMVGTVRVRILGATAGTRVTLRYGEMLNADGSLYTANLRSAHATDRYVASGTGEELYEPRFTFHGFRYVELTGLPAAPDRDTLRGIVWQSDLRPTGTFACSSQRINRLQQNIRWGQRGNYLDLPTDCPQRDERLGWTGDAQIFIGTAAFNYDVATFFHKWCRDLRDGQKPNGSFPDVAPDALALARADKPELFPHPHDGNAAWADAGVICPWVVYQRYGDIRILTENYAAMTAWIGYQQRTSRDLLRPDTAYGDWLATDAVTPFRAPTPCDLIGTAYFAESTRVVAAAAGVLGHQVDALRYASLHADIVAAFQREYVTAGGRVTGDTQTGYLLALAFDLLPVQLRTRAIARLVYLIEKNGNRLSTGFVGTPQLCPVLSRFGRNDVAFQLLNQRAYPSWLYPVVNGATTMWERWNSWNAETGFSDVGMNSFNHYAYGAVGEWMYRTIGGIDFDPAAPAGKRLVLAPIPGGGLTHAKATFASPYGPVRSEWRLQRSRWIWRVTVPANTTAVARVPARRIQDVRCGGVPLLQAPGASRVHLAAKRVSFELAAGSYELAVRAPLLPQSPV